MRLNIFVSLIVMSFSYLLEASLVKINNINPSIFINLRYATKDNFTSKQIYSKNADAYLLDFVAEKLSLVQNYLKEKGLGLKVWDAYRPLYAQWKLWNVCPDSRYVYPPEKGGKHTRGTTVDLTLVLLVDGKELSMPTGFDDFTPKAYADCMSLSQELIDNRELLRQAMEKFGFKGIKNEWWHFDIDGWQHYPVLDISFEELEKK